MSRVPLPNKEAACYTIVFAVSHSKKPSRTMHKNEDTCFEWIEMLFIPAVYTHNCYSLEPWLVLFKEFESVHCPVYELWFLLLTTCVLWHAENWMVLYVCMYVCVFGKVQMTLCSVCVQKMHISWCVGVPLTNACGLQCVHKVKGAWEWETFFIHKDFELWAVTLCIAQDKTWCVLL